MSSLEHYLLLALFVIGVSLYGYAIGGWTQVMLSVGVSLMFYVIGRTLRNMRS